MNISGYQDNNFHDGSTQILGDLVIDGKLTLGGTTGQSEYLDSGDYTGTILGVPSHWISMGLKPTTEYRYQKNGNIIQVYLYLRGEIKTNTQFPQISVNVPSTDLFNVGHTGNAYAYSSFILPTGRQIYTTVNQFISTSGSGQTRVLIFYEGNSATNNQETVDLFVHLVYKLTGTDIPATVLVSGGTGQGDVQNPMLESLDAGGYNINNVGTLSATLINAPNVLTNPLNLDLDANNNKINNCIEIKTTGQQLRLIGGPLHLENDSGATDIIVSNNFDMNGSDVKDVNLLQVNTINPFNTSNIIIEAPSGEAKMIGSSKAIVESSDDVEIICDLGSNVRLTNNLTLQGQTIFLDSNTGIIDVANGNINNVDFITNPDQPIVITGSTIEMRSNPPNTGKVEFYTSIDMDNKNIENVQNIITQRVLGKAGTPLIIDSAVGFDIELKDATSIEGNLDMNGNNIVNINSAESKIFNTIKYIRTEEDFVNPLVLSGVYVIIGTVIITDPLNIVGPCLIAGYNNTSTLLFNITTGNELTQCLRNTNNSGNIELKDFIFTNQCTSTRAGSFFNNSVVNTNILRVSNVNYFNCKNNFPLRLSGFELVEILNCTFRYNYGGTSGPMCNIDSSRNTLIESCEFYNNYQLGNTSVIYSSALLSISGTSNNITISGNQFATYGAGSLGGIDISDFGTTNRVIIDGNVFDAEGGSDPLKLLIVDLSIHKGVICNENTGIVTCEASLEGIVNGNTIYTATQAGVWVPIDLTGFVTGDISRFVPGLSPYSFVYDATNPIKSLISINCSADHSTGGTDIVQLGISVNGLVSVFIQADLNSGQTQAVNLTTVLNLNFEDTIQLVCQNLTAGTNANGFRAVSLNASLIEI